jgi:hypothetical protein
MNKKNKRKITNKNINKKLSINKGKKLQKNN